MAEWFFKKGDGDGIKSFLRGAEIKTKKITLLILCFLFFLESIGDTLAEDWISAPRWFSLCITHVGRTP